jgi:hypothetical protein
MTNKLINSIFLILLSLCSLAQEGVKALSSNINYLYGDLKRNPLNQNSTKNQNKFTSLALPFKDDFFIPQLNLIHLNHYGATLLPT